MQVSRHTALRQAVGGYADHSRSRCTAQARALLRRSSRLGRRLRTWMRRHVRRAPAVQWVRPATHACDGSDLLAAQAARVCFADLSVSALKASGAHCSATAGRCTRTRGALRTGTAARKARTRTSRDAHRLHLMVRCQDWANGDRAASDAPALCRHDCQGRAMLGAFSAEFKEMAANGDGSCTSDFMGGDPLEGVAKMCICIPCACRFRDCLRC